MSKSQTETLVKKEYKEEAEKLDKLLSIVDERQQEKLNNFLDAAIFLASNNKQENRKLA